ncbi:MAG: amidohydrolase, partial [Methanobacteriota archaeon]
AAESAPEGQWIIGRGWHQNKWTDDPSTYVNGFPAHQKLSEAVPDHPVYLIHASGHAILVNKKAMELAGISADTPDPEGGEIIRDPSGNPTGVFVENAENLIARVLPARSREEKIQALLKAQESCFRNGITMFHDAGVGREDIELYKSLYQQGKLKIRLYVMLDGSDSLLLADYFKNGPEIGLYDDHLFIRSVKLYIDGALGSRGAWFLEPYSDRPGYTAKPVTPLKKLELISHQAAQAGFQVCTHAIGDRANQEILKIYKKVLSETNNPFQYRFRIEHAQHVAPEDIPEFAKWSIIASMQGIHFASDILWAIDRLGEKRIRNGSYAWQSFLKNQVTLMNGTDVPVEDINPFPNLYTLITRKTLDGQFKTWFNENEKLTPLQALKAYTLNNAYGAFLEDKTGSISEGKYADLTVISNNPLTAPPDKLKETKVLFTMINGEIVYPDSLLKK